MWGTIGIILATVVFLFYLYKFYKGKEPNYWEQRGIKFLKTNLSTAEIFSGKLPDPDYFAQIGDDKFGGAIIMGSPILFVKDIELAKQIFIKDFDHFVDRRDFGTDNVLKNSLSLLEGERWKIMRHFLSPTFTSGKIRRMFQHFENGGRRLVNYVHTRSKSTNVPTGFDVDVSVITRRYTVDIIAAVAFGIDTNTFENEDSVFYKMAAKTSEFSCASAFRLFFMYLFPRLSTTLGLTMLGHDVTQFFANISKQALKERESSTDENKPNDFLQLLVEANKANSEENEILDDHNSLNQMEKDALLNFKKPKIQLPEEMLIAQAFLFFVAGFDTVANFLNLANYLLAANPDIQEKVFEDVEKVMKSNGDKITYEGINAMEYLNKYTSEIMRLYPALARIERKCTKDYKIPGTDKIILKGTIVGVLCESIHRDEKYYPNAMTFDPENFSAENKAARNPYAYMPFGVGPRSCIGMRFALVESKVALAQLVRQFKILPNQKTPIPVQITKLGAVFRAPADLQVTLVPRT